MRIRPGLEPIAIQLKVLPISMCLCFFFILGPVSGLYAQDYEWEVDKLERKNKEKQSVSDSAIMSNKGLWEIQLAAGVWVFDQGARSDLNELFFYPQVMDSWRLMATWHLRERFSLNLGVAMSLERNIPPTPDLVSVIQGEDIELEGSGGLFLPIDLEVKHYFLTQRFKPFLGLGIGAVIANSQYILVEGNRNDGFTNSTSEVSDQAVKGHISSGFDYRAAEHIGFNFSFSYHYSSSFSEAQGGYTRFQGWAIHGGFSVVF